MNQDLDPDSNSQEIGSSHPNSNIPFYNLTGNNFNAAPNESIGNSNGISPNAEFENGNANGHQPPNPVSPKDYKSDVNFPTSAAAGKTDVQRNVRSKSISNKPNANNN